IYVAADAARMGVSPGSTVLLFLLIWIVSWGVLYFVVLKTPPGYVVGVVTAIVVVIAAWLFVKFIPVGQDDNHVLSIGIGGGFGLIMLMNDWRIIWRNNKRINQGKLAGSTPETQAVSAREP